MLGGGIPRVDLDGVVKVLPDDEGVGDLHLGSLKVTHRAQRDPRPLVCRKVSRAQLKRPLGVLVCLVDQRLLFFLGRLLQQGEERGE